MSDETTPESTPSDALDLGPLPTATEQDNTPKDGAKPRTRRTRGPAKPRTTAPRRSTKVDIAGGMANLYETAAIAVSIIPSRTIDGTQYTATQQVAAVIMENSAQCGKAWDALAKDNPAVRQTLERMLAVSAVGALVAAHTPILIAAVIAAGVMPPGMAAILGTVAQQSTPRPAEDA